MGQRRVVALPRTAAQGGLGLRSVVPDSLFLGNGVAAPAQQALLVTGQQLRSNGSNWVPKAEGKILQSVLFTDAVSHIVTAGSVPIWTFSLTLKKSNSKVLLMLALATARSSTTHTYGRYNLYRITTTPAFNSSVYAFGYPFCYYPTPTPEILALATVDGLYLDSPGVAAGGVVTYTVYLENTPNLGSLNVNWYGTAFSTAILSEVAV